MRRIHFPRALLWALAVLLAASLAGCGGQRSSGAATQAGTASLKGQTVEVSAEWTGTEQANFQKVLDEFARQTGATVHYTSSGRNTAAFLGGRLAGGNPPDVALLPNPGLLQDLAAKGSLKPIDQVAVSAVSANYAPVWRDLGTVGGKLYAVWYKAANKSTVWYNKHVFDQAGVQPPKTWAEFKQALETISASGTTPLSVGAGEFWPPTDWFENVYIRTAGPDQYDKLFRHQLLWTDPSVKQAFQTMGEILTNPKYLAGGTQGALSTDFPTSVQQVFADPPKAAIVYEGDFVASVITGDTKAKLGTDADFFDFPAIGASQPTVVGGGDAAVLLKDSPGGQALIRFLASPEAAAIQAATGGFTSPNKRVALSAYPDDITRRSAQALTTATVFRFDGSDLMPAAVGGTAGAGFPKALQDYLRNPGQLDAILKRLEPEVAKAYTAQP